MKATTFPEFEELAKLKHGGLYSYKPEGYTDACGKVVVVCNLHGKYQQRAGDHLKGHGCPECGKAKSLASKKAKGYQHLEQITAKHPNYEFPEYLQNFTKVTDKCLAICPEHGPFYMTTHHLKKGKGCRQCGLSQSAKSRTLDLGDFKLRLGESKYTYIDDSYLGHNKPMTIVCPTHGEFQQTPAAHVTRNAGCPKCAAYANSQVVKYEHDQLLARCLEVHKDKGYTYPNKLEGLVNLWDINCQKHGNFQQLGYVHLRGSVCPKCANIGSAGQRDMLEYIKAICPDAVSDYRFSDAHRQQIDVYIPSLKMGFEYDGIFWHSSKYKDRTYHLNKQNLAKAEGISLYQIFSDEWDTEAAKKLIRSRISHSTGIYARLCRVVKIEDFEAQAFHGQHHIQGWKRRGWSYALEYMGQNVAVMTFTAVSSHRGVTQNGKDFELARFSSCCRVVGGASKLFKAAVAQLGVNCVISYSDNRLFSGGMYEKLGFQKVHITAPSYSYTTSNTVKRIHKSHFRHSKLKALLGDNYDPALTEKANCEAAGYFQVYDCGLTKWVWEL